ncbi:MAG: 5,10-methylenetetrahydrofolate reductase [Ruminococcaceae bacterium]|nr:5,10-methylenetetrahydrofolate reductase [Oscillospiraceae bacterium]
MIFTKKKSFEELLSLLDGRKKVALVGCGSCAAACKTGGADEVAALAEALSANGIEVVGSCIPQESCQKLLVKKELKAVRDAGAECVVSLACGSGAQTVAQNTALPVFPANNTMYLAQVERIGVYNEMCRFCGDCLLGYTAGICPITQCAKSLVNGPCGGQKNGKCEVNPAQDCAWIAIYNKMTEQGREGELLERMIDDRSHADRAHPRTDNLREKKGAAEA